MTRPGTTPALAVVIALQLAWIGATVFVQERRLGEGAVVRLETAPVDPRDLLRGDFVILSYKISRIDEAKFASPAPDDIPEGSTVYVRLVEQGEFHEVEMASLHPLVWEAARPVVRGRVEPTSSWQAGGAPHRHLRLSYGLERYYVAEGTGNPQGKLTVEASVPRSGRAAIRNVFIDGRPYAEVMKTNVVGPSR